MTVRDIVKILHPLIDVQISGKSETGKVYMGTRDAKDVPIMFGDYKIKQIRISKEPVLDIKCRKTGEKPVFEIIVEPEDNEVTE